MKSSTAEIWNKVVIELMKELRTSRERAEDVIKSHETWLVDMVEAVGETDPIVLAEGISAWYE